MNGDGAPGVKQLLSVKHVLTFTIVRRFNVPIAT